MFTDTKNNLKSFKWTTINWQYSLLLTFLFGSIVFLFYPVLKQLVIIWYTNENYSHGFIVIPISLYVSWKQKNIFDEKLDGSSISGFFICLIAIITYLIAYYAEIFTAASICLILMLAGGVVYLYGFNTLRGLMFPFFLLFFMIPIPSQIYSMLTMPLQLLVSKFNVWFASNLGIPIFREGNVIFLPEHTLEVVQACSGLRSIISLLLMSSLIGYFSMRSNVKRFVLFFAGIPAAIFANSMRIFLMICAFYYFNLNLTEGPLHTILGIVVFFLSLLIIFFIRGILEGWKRREQKK